MPVYNLGAYVAESIASVQAQTWKHWELVVINDGSTDNTEEVVQALACRDSRIRLRSQRNSGTAAARNCGLEIIQGEFLVFLDGDDVWRKDFLAKAVASVTETGSDGFICGLERLQQDASLLPVTMEIHPGFSNSADLIEQVLTGKACLVMGNVVLKVTPAVRALRFVEGCRHAEDTEYLLRALSTLNSLFFLESPLFLYRTRPGSATQQAFDWRVRIDAHYAMERALEHLLSQAHESRRPVLEKEHRRLHFLKYRFLYQLVKTDAWSGLRDLLGQPGWQRSLHSVARGDRLKHRVKARIVLSQNPLAWKVVSLYARWKSWSILG